MFWKIVGILEKRARSKCLVGLDLDRSNFEKSPPQLFFQEDIFWHRPEIWFEAKDFETAELVFFIGRSFANFLSTVRRCRRRRRRRWRPGCRRLSGRSTRWCRCCACSSQSTSAASSRQTSELTPAEGNAFESLPWFNYQWTLSFILKALDAYRWKCKTLNFSTLNFQLYVILGELYIKTQCWKLICMLL